MKSQQFSCVTLSHPALEAETRHQRGLQGSPPLLDAGAGAGQSPQPQSSPRSKVTMPLPFSGSCPLRGHRKALPARGSGHPSLKTTTAFRPGWILGGRHDISSADGKIAAPPRVLGGTTRLVAVSAEGAVGWGQGRSPHRRFLCPEAGS